MSRQILAIGDTGTQLVSKFNGNAQNSNIRVYNVEDYGAVHDLNWITKTGTDDTVAIQATINACYAAGGGTVYFPNGIYYIHGVLQTQVPNPYYTPQKTNNNSQLYIPYSNSYLNKNVQITLLGEGINWSSDVFVADKIPEGVLLYSDIAGSGVFPSVISSMGTKPNPEAENVLNYTETTYDNIAICVHAFGSTTGVSMSGVNHKYTSHDRIKKLYVGTDVRHADTIIPSTEVFGLYLGYTQGDFAKIDQYYCAYGFTYGLVAGDFIKAAVLEIYGCKYAIAVAGIIVVDYLVANWNKYTIVAPGVGSAIIGGGSLEIKWGNIEKGLEADGHGTPSWCYYDDLIYDIGNNINGYVSHIVVPGESYIIKANGGNNILLKNIYQGDSLFYWTTATRPITGNYHIGMNLTTGKVEVYDGSNWHNLW